MGIESIAINVTNTTNGDIPISLFGNPADLSDNSNQTREFRWDVTGISLTSENIVSIQYRPNSLIEFTTYNASLLQPTLQGVLNALNGLGIGSFFSFTSGGNTYISNYDNSYVFGVLDIWDNASTSVLWNVDCIGTTGNNQVQAGFFLDNEANPYTASTPVPISVDGQTIGLDGTTSNQPSTKIKVYNQTTNTFIVNTSLGSSVLYSYSFQAYYGNAYLITIVDY